MSLLTNPNPAAPTLRIVHGQGQSVRFSNVSAVKVTGREIALTFDLAWDGSWRSPPG